MSDRIPGPDHRATDQKIITPATAGAPVNSGVPTQIANPTRASLRTIVQAAGAGLLAVNSAAVAVGVYLESDPAAPELLGHHYGQIVAGANLIVAATGLLSGLAARIMAAPPVADFITKYVPALAPIRPSA